MQRWREVVPGVRDPLYAVAGWETEGGLSSSAALVAVRDIGLSRTLCVEPQNGQFRRKSISDIETWSLIG